MKRKLFLISVIMLISGCSVSGNYRSEGPCKGFHKYPEACESAAANSSVIGKVVLGQSLEEVRQIMGKDPERREVTENLETWGYITSYADNRFTTITFKNGKVSSIK